MGLRLSWFLAALPALVGSTRHAWAEEPVTITVQGDAPYGELAADPFAATSRLRRERLAAPALRASEALRSEVGVQISEAGGLGAPATASIRGATAAQTPVYLGGVRLNDLVGSVADLSTLPLWLIDHVDVYRGSVPFDTDDGNIGGAILFEPRRPRSPEAAAGLTGGSFGTRSGFGYLALGNDDAGMLLGVSAERADNDYELTDDRGTLFDSSDDARRRRQNSDSRLRDVWLLLRGRPSRRARLDLLANDVAREQGAPKLALLPSRSARARLERRALALTARLAAGGSDRGLLSLRASLLDTTTEIFDPERELGTLTEHTSVRGQRAEQYLGLSYRVADELTMALGTSAGEEALERADDARESSARALDVGARARADFEPWPGLHLLGVLGVRCRGTGRDESGCDHFTPTGRLGAGWRGQGATAFLNLSGYAREPALGELYGVGLLVRGNEQLRPERGIGVDAGGRVSRRWGGLSLHAEASGFARQSSELVVYARTAQGYVVPLNVGRARVMGLELGAGARAFERLELGCSATLLDPRDTTEGPRPANDILPFVSRLVLAPRLGVGTGALDSPGLSHAELNLELNYLSNRFADRAGLIVIPEQATLSLVTSLSWLSDALVTRLRLANLLDAERFDIVGYPLPGRSIFFSAEVRAP